MITANAGAPIERLERRGITKLRGVDDHCKFPNWENVCRQTNTKPATLMVNIDLQIIAPQSRGTSLS